MKYGNFIFRCNCGNEIEITPDTILIPHSSIFNALYWGSKRVGLQAIQYNQHVSCICSSCHKAVDKIITDAKKRNATDIRNAIRDFQNSTCS